MTYTYKLIVPTEFMVVVGLKKVLECLENVDFAPVTATERSISFHFQTNEKEAESIMSNIVFGGATLYTETDKGWVLHSSI